MQTMDGMHPLKTTYSEWQNADVTDAECWVSRNLSYCSIFCMSKIFSKTCFI